VRLTLAILESLHHARHLRRRIANVPKDTPLFFMETARSCLKHTYQQPDPRAAMCALARLDYALADTGAAIFRQLIQARAVHAGRPLQVLDIGCGYGLGTAMLRLPLTFADLRARYTAREMLPLDAIDLEELDRLYYAAWPRRDQHRYVGIDGREAAVGYAHRVGTLDSGIVADLERDDPDDALAAEILRADIIVATGRIGTRTAARIAAAASRGEAPWIATFMPRTAPADELATCLRPLGLTTEKFEGGSFALRHFESAAEKERALSVLQAQGLDPAGKEASGWMHVDLHVARPAHIAASIALHRMVEIAGPRPLFRYSRSA
jgi:hypothetical protein